MSAAFTPTVVPEDVYDAMIHSYRHCPKPARWKYPLKNAQGSKVVVRYEKQGNAGLFVFYKDNTRYAVIGDESVRSNGMDNTQHPGHEQFAEQVAANATGNHSGRNWHIRVPTRPSEPVRG